MTTTNRFAGLTNTPPAAAPAPVQQPAAAAPVAHQQAPSQQHQSQAPARPAPSRPAYPGEGGIGDVPTDDGGGGSLPYANTFGNLTAGDHSFLVCVESITHWQDEPGAPLRPSLGLRVRVGPEAGREIGWDQTPPRNMSDAFTTRWKSTLLGAYHAGGWTYDPSADGSWPGWHRSNGSLVPPYADFFIEDVDGVSVPIMLAATIRVDAGYEGRPKVIAVRRHLIDGSLVQAPVPQKVTPWIAERHRWSGERKDITVKANDKRPGYVVQSVKLKWDQIPRGVGGMLTLKDCKQ